MERFSPRHLGLAHLTILEVPPLELVDLAAAAGFHRIGLRLQPAFAGSQFYRLRAGSAASREMQRRLRDTGVQVYDIEFLSLNEHFDVSHYAALLEDAQALGAQRLSVCGDDANEARLVASFASLCEQAQKHGLGVDLEYMAWREVACFEDALAIVLGAGCANGGVLIDTLHLWRTGGSPLDVQRAPPGVIRSIQLSDAQTRSAPTTREAQIAEGRCGRLPPGQGALPLKDLLLELPADTALSVEAPGTGSQNPRQYACRVFEAARDLLASCGTVEAP